MGKIILTNHQGDTKIEFPKELIFLFKQSKSRRIKAGLIYDNDTKVLSLTVTDIDWYEVTNIGYIDSSRSFIDRRRSLLVSTGETQCYVRSNDRYRDDAMNTISFCVMKGKGYTICEKIELDYTIYQNPNGEILITAAMYVGSLPLNRNEYKVRNSKSTLYSEIHRMVPNINSHRFYSAVNDIGEIYYFKEINENNIVYVTKDKYAYAIANGISEEALSLRRTMSIGKFFKDHLPEVSEATVNAYIEYNKMLTCFDSNLFSVVTGDDIIKYYLKDSYFRMTGELGNSCMRDSSKSHVIKFYSKNSNFRLLIMKAGQTDSIMARALLVTTTDGTVFMDRIYSVDTKLITLFHRYAKENDIKNIYEYRKSCNRPKNLLTMGPGNWYKEYDDNYKVDLDWLPAAIDKQHDACKYQVAVMQQSNISSSYDVPYIDNFQYINAFTRQASVNALNFFTACELSGELIDNNEVYYDNGKVYDRRFVNTGYNIDPTLKIDTVTLDSSDDDIDEADEDYEEDIDWDEADLDAEQEVEENPYTIAALNEVGTLNSGVINQITNYQAYDSLTPEAVARMLGVSPELQNILVQINDIATDSQQEQHLF
jgi:succinate dehydrogenase flavin-adding protein (antitoxin of CptAB toxin-antitoxin module)